MEHNILYFGRMPVRFCNIDKNVYVSLSDVKISRPDESLIKQTLFLDSYGYIPVEIIELKDAIKLIKDNKLQQFIEGVTA